jgi:hypothetical protein
MTQETGTITTQTQLATEDYIYIYKYRGAVAADLKFFGFLFLKG